MKLHILLLLPAVIQITQACECGRAVADRIVDGTLARDGDFPWLASLIENTDRTFSYCGAAIVSTYYVVTASHCLRGKNVKDFSVLVGGYNLSNLDPGHEYVDIDSVVMYGYKNETGINIILKEDLAVVKLKSPIAYGPHIQPICLPSKGNFFDGVTATVAGYGSTDNAMRDPRSASKVPLKIQVKVDTLAECHKNLRHQFHFKNEVLCAHSTVSDQGVCQGDSGGPLFYRKKDQYELIGVVSATTGDCNNELHDLYVNVTYYIDWLQAHIGNTGCQI